MPTVGDPIYRKVKLRERARTRVRRRVDKLLAYIDAHPGATRDNDPQIERLDDLVGDADVLVRLL